MAIRNPTTLLVNFSADIKTDIGSGKSLSTSVINDATAIPFSSYSTGSLDLDNTMGEVTLGKASAGVLSCTNPIFVRTEEMGIPITTKLFAYNGDATTLYVENAAQVPVTIEYCIGSTLI